jgi:hypothetical protein
MLFSYFVDDFYFEHKIKKITFVLMTLQTAEPMRRSWYKPPFLHESWHRCERFI